MDMLIEALTILRKYGNPPSPTHCEHDTLWVMIDHTLVSPGDLARLKKLHFSVDQDGGCFISSWFGSA